MPSPELIPSDDTTVTGGEPPAHAQAAPLVELVDVVRVRWTADKGFSPATLDKCGETIRRFGRRLAHQGVTDLHQVTPQLCQAFIDAPTVKGMAPELTTRHARRSALRMLFTTLRELGHHVGDPTLDLHLPARTARAARPLTRRGGDAVSGVIADGRGRRAVPAPGRVLGPG